MPSAEETTYLIEVVPDTTQDFLSRDVDFLVSQIKENLRLSGLKAKSSVTQKNRPSPYQIPSRSWADPNNCEMCCTKNTAHDNRHHLSHHHHQHHHHLLHHHNHNKRTATRDDDPYELLQELLREGGLIKEAVKRLQSNLDDLNNSEIDEDNDKEDEKIKLYQRKPYFYDSEDEQLPSAYEPLEL